MDLLDDLCYFLTCEWTVQGLVSVSLVPLRVQLVRDLVVLYARERGSVSVDTRQGGELRIQTLDHVPYCHTRGDTMRVDDEIGRHSQVVEGQILLSVGHSDSSLLTVSRGELVSDLRNSSLTNSHLGFLYGVVKKNYRILYKKESKEKI